VAEVALGVPEGVGRKHVVQQEMCSGSVVAVQVAPVVLVDTRIVNDKLVEIAGAVEDAARIGHLTTLQTLQLRPQRGTTAGRTRSGRERTAEPLEDTQHGTSGAWDRRQRRPWNGYGAPAGARARLLVPSHRRGAKGASSSQARSMTKPHAEIGN